MSNPILNEKFMSQERVLDSEPMSINGAISKTLILLVLVVISSLCTWSLIAQGAHDKAMVLMTSGLIGGFIFAIATIICVNKSLGAVKFLAPLYAIFEGLALGGISAMFEAQYAGIVFQAICGTFASLFVMLMLYKANIIRATEKFRSVLFVATLSIAVIYVIQLVASFFSRGIPGIFEAGLIGIGFSALVVVIASLNFINDFDIIERAAQNMAPKDFEWYGAFGLMVTLVWLYLEILRLLSKLNSRR